MTVTAGARLRVGMHIGGEEVAAVGGRWFDTVDPFTGQAWAEVARGDARDVERAVASRARRLRGRPMVRADRDRTGPPPASTR